MRKEKEKTDIIGLVTFGVFLIIVGAIFLSTPKLVGRIYDFFSDIEIKEVYPPIYLPTPKSDHQILYTAISQFSLAFALFHIPLLIGRFVVKDTVEKKSDTISGILFWFGAYKLFNLLIGKQVEWFIFLGYLITLIGASVVVRNIIVLISYFFQKTKF